MEFLMRVAPGYRCSLPALLLVLGMTTPILPADVPAGETLQLNLRTRVETFKGSGVWDEVTLHKELHAKETAIILCDVWDNHWCGNAAKRCDLLAHKMVPVLDAARRRGVQIIHAPSDCMGFYKDAPQRKRIQEAPRVEPPKPLTLTDPPLPIDDSDGGCDDAMPDKEHRAWTRQHAAIPIAENDVISDNGNEVYSFLKQHGIKNLIIMGVHTNMCVCNRSFAIKQMTKWGIRCVLARDLTDSMYNPKKAPFVSHDAGTELVVQHIEKYWCPTILSSDVTAEAKALPQK
jgi:nicotinamidase-related amidase